MRHLSPRELADALGVSESSLKRWVDAGKIVAFRTEGGHRRITVNEAVRFIRATNAPVARPELLGMPEIAVAQNSQLGRSERLLDFLLEGDVIGARGWLLSRYLGGASIAALADGPIREAMHELGELWQHSEQGIFVEHRATDACLHAVVHLRNMIEPPANAPLALGAGPEDDPYILAPLLAATVLSAAGLRAVNLGPDTPLGALQQAFIHHHPRLVWISASVPINSARAKAISRWLSSIASSTTAVVGGRHSGALVGRGIVHVETMAELSDVATRITMPATRTG
ncbi:MAG TPA: helix-turn-helix domain-containing protein [Kofleriaceae bacterium]